MRKLMCAASAVVALAVGALAMDGDRVVSGVEWDRLYAELRESDDTSLRRGERLRALAACHVVESTVKILDVAEDSVGVRIEVCGTRSDRWRETIRVHADDREAVTEWRRWDRLVLRFRPVVEADKVASWRLLTERASEMQRTPNPGIESEPEPIGVRPESDYRTWLRAFASADLKGDVRRTADMMDDANGRSWRFRAEVEAAPEGRSVRVRLLGDLGLRTRRRDWYGVETFRIDLVVEDPQVRAVLAVGARVAVVATLRGRGTGGSLDLAYRFLRIE